MAIAKSEKKVLDQMKADERWKCHVRSEDASCTIWQHDWGWIMDEYHSLQTTLKEKSKQSKFLNELREEPREDPRKLSDFPNTVNHEYGWIAAKQDFQLQRYGSDTFKPLPLPDAYRIPK